MNASTWVVVSFVEEYCGSLTPTGETQSTTLFGFSHVPVPEKSRRCEVSQPYRGASSRSLFCGDECDGVPSSPLLGLSPDEGVEVTLATGT